MIVDLKRDPETENAWFDLGGGGRVHVRLLSEKDIDDIIKATRSTVPEYPLLKDPVTGIERYHRFEATKFDTDLFDEMNFDRSIVSWENILDGNEAPIPVTRENKVLLMAHVAEFRRAVEGALEALKAGAQEKRALEEKNGLPT